MEKKLYRDEYRKKIAGVCAGLADYFNVDVAIVRMVFVLALIFHGGGGLVYIIFWIVLPKKIYTFNDPNVDYTVPSQTPGSANNPFKGNPFPNQPFPNQPYPSPPRSTSLVGIVIGVVLIIIGGSILLDDFDIIPDWDFGRLWPIVLVAVGAALIFSGEKKKPWEDTDWHKTDANKTAENVSEANPAAGDTPPTDNPPAV
ncbi:MAG: PspC protein [Mucilaginibacter sp.]|nr:PspC protein [Mucilaginibacter sp.]